MRRLMRGKNNANGGLDLGSKSVDREVRVRESRNESESRVQS